MKTHTYPSPQATLDSAISEAFQPHLPALRAAVLKDRELAAAAEAVGPIAVRERADELLAAACAGSAEAEAELAAAGGFEGYTQAQSGMYSLLEAKRASFCLECLPLVESVSEAVLAAVESAALEIQEEWASLLRFADAPHSPHPWAVGHPSRFYNLARAARDMPDRCRSRIGIAALLEGSGWIRFVEPPQSEIP